MTKQCGGNGGCGGISQSMASQDIWQRTRLWAELEAEGVPLEPRENRVGVTMPEDLTIRPGRQGRRAEIMELASGRFAFILPLFIRRDRPGKTIIVDAWIGTPWFDSTIDWLLDPRETGSHPGYYYFAQDPEPFVRKEVLNHRIHCTLSRGDIREGFLLAVGSAPPESYKHRDQVPVTLGLVDQWDVEHRATFGFTISRRAARPREQKRERGPLLSCRDVIKEPRSLKAPPTPKAQTIAEEIEAYCAAIEYVSHVTRK
jgi:hypothetical protein